VDPQTLINTFLGVALSAIGWFARTLWDAVNKLKDDLQEIQVRSKDDLRSLEVKVSADYVRYDRLQDALKPLMDALDDIRNTLSTKADKR
jgi:hypothetical protein